MEAPSSANADRNVRPGPRLTMAPTRDGLSLLLAFLVVAIPDLATRGLQVKRLETFGVTADLNYFVAERRNVFRSIVKNIAVPGPSPQIEMSTMFPDSQYVGTWDDYRSSPIFAFWPYYHVQRWTTWVITEIEIWRKCMIEPTLTDMRPHILRGGAPTVFPVENEPDPSVEDPVLVGEPSCIEFGCKDESTLYGNQSLAIDTVGFDHLLQLAGRAIGLLSQRSQRTETRNHVEQGGNCYYARQEQCEDFQGRIVREQLIPQYPVPLQHLTNDGSVIVGGLLCFALSFGGSVLSLFFFLALFFLNHRIRCMASILDFALLGALVRCC